MRCVGFAVVNTSLISKTKHNELLLGLGAEIILTSYDGIKTENSAK